MFKKSFPKRFTWALLIKFKDEPHFKWDTHDGDGAPKYSLLVWLLYLVKGHTTVVICNRKVKWNLVHILSFEFWTNFKVLEVAQMWIFAPINSSKGPSQKQPPILTTHMSKQTRQHCLLFSAKVLYATRLTALTRKVTWLSQYDLLWCPPWWTYKCSEDPYNQNKPEKRQRKRKHHRSI